MRTKRDAGLPPAVDPQLQSQVITQEREYKLITPLFGGGAVTGECDEVTVVRGTEVRGQLRFWWRACYGGRYDTVEEMKEDEDRIWGSASMPEQIEKTQEGEEKKKPEPTVQIIVEVIDKGTPVEPFKYKPILNDAENPRKEYWRDEYQTESEVPQYAAFMFQLSKKAKEKEEEPEKKFVYDGVKFKLTISFAKELRTDKEIQKGEKIRKDIEGALWAWETFGGIGARTRRGFGALHMEKAMYIKKEGNSEEKKEITYPLPAANEKEVRSWIDRNFAEFGIGKKALINIPCLSNEMHFEVIDFQDNARMTWNGLIDALSSFRQKRSGSQNRKGSFGRSQWPEAEAIREITGKRDRDKYDRLPHPEKFPRAAFGLPINFHFKDKRDPEDVVLQGSKKGHDRFASPLILRPLCCQNNKVVGLAVVLENFALPDEDLILKETKSGKEHHVSAKLESNEVKDVSPLSGDADVLQVFRQHLKLSNQESNQKNNRERGNNR